MTIMAILALGMTVAERCVLLSTIVINVMLIEIKTKKVLVKLIPMVLLILGQKEILTLMPVVILIRSSMIILHSVVPLTKKNAVAVLTLTLKATLARMSC